MTVKELIDKLQEFSGDLDVIDTSCLLTDGTKIVKYTYGDSANLNARTEKTVVTYLTKVI